MALTSHNRHFHHQRSRSTAISLEELLRSISAKLTASRPDQVDSIIEDGLSNVLNLTRAGCVCWYEEEPESDCLKLVLYSTDRLGPEILPSILTRNDLPYTFKALSSGRPVVVRSPEDLPDDATHDRDFLRKRSIWGLIMTSSDHDTQRKGVLAVAYLPEDTQLTDNLVGQLTVLNNLVATCFDRKKVFELWRESEAGFRWLFQNAPVGIAIGEFAGNLLFVNPALCSMLGYSNHELLGIDFRELSVSKNDEDTELYQRLQDGLVEHYRTEEQLIRKDRGRIWGRVDVALLLQGTEQTPFVIRMVEDITARKYADEELLRTRTELEQLAGHLIQAQEEERHRISRELHDDIAQRVSLIAIEIDAFGQSLANAGCDKELDNVSGLKAEMDDLANDVHTLSHRLHSTRLQHLGLRSAIEELTKQVRKQYQISINLSTYGRDTLLPPDVALCLFRVTQEGLNNVIRHSHARDVFIELNVERGTARLQISDTGVGFEIAGCENGIGLVSMRERLRMVGGEFSIQSREGEGTLITATVRFSEMIKDRAA